jgi:hypothetical protein
MYNKCEQVHSKYWNLYYLFSFQRKLRPPLTNFLKKQKSIMKEQQFHLKENYNYWLKESFSTKKSYSTRAYELPRKSVQSMYLGPICNTSKIFNIDHSSFLHCIFFLTFHSWTMVIQFGSLKLLCVYNLISTSLDFQTIHTLQSNSLHFYPLTSLLVKKIQIRTTRNIKYGRENENCKI